MSSSEILVGVDGSATGQATVRWAAREAHRRRSRLRITHVFDWQWYGPQFGSGDVYLEQATKAAQSVVDSAEQQARSAAPAVPVRTDALLGTPADLLVQLSAEAELTVVGHRGRGGFSGLLLGSVSQRLTTHAHGPVVVVRGRSDTGQGPVVAGVDDSPAAELVLATAFEAAVQRATGLVVVRAVLPVSPLLFDGVPATERRTPTADDAEHARLDGLLEPWRQKYPQVAAEVLVSHQGAAAVLTGMSRGAQLVVVGSRGHSALASVLLGSTGMQLSHHAGCPVLITRPHPDHAAPR